MTMTDAEKSLRRITVPAMRELRAGLDFGARGQRKIKAVDAIARWEDRRIWAGDDRATVYALGAGARTAIRCADDESAITYQAWMDDQIDAARRAQRERQSERDENDWRRW